MKPVKAFILDYIQAVYTLPEGTDTGNLDYVQTGYVDSMEILRFIVTLEDEYGIEFTDDELRSPEFRIVGSLASMVERKVERKNERTKASQPA